jgi:cytidine deaminase
VNEKDAESLRAAAEAAGKQAHAPYSGLRVGAAVRSVSGKVYLGCNVENASYGLTLCAERTAVAAAVVAEGAAFRIAAVAVVARDGAGAAVPAPPCGACRQVIDEFGRDSRIGFLDLDHCWVWRPAAELLPHGFLLPPR